MYESETKNYLEMQISSSRTGTEVESIEPELVLHIQEPYNYELFIGVLDTKTGTYFSGCGCSSDSVYLESQESKEAPMDIEDYASSSCFRKRLTISKGKNLEVCGRYLWPGSLEVWHRKSEREFT